MKTDMRNKTTENVVEMIIIFLHFSNTIVKRKDAERKAWILFSSYCQISLKLFLFDIVLLRIEIKLIRFFYFKRNYVANYTYIRSNYTYIRTHRGRRVRDITGVHAVVRPRVWHYPGCAACN